MRAPNYNICTPLFVPIGYSFIPMHTAIPFPYSFPGYDRCFWLRSTHSLIQCDSHPIAPIHPKFAANNHRPICAPNVWLSHPSLPPIPLLLVICPISANSSPIDCYQISGIWALPMVLITTLSLTRSLCHQLTHYVFLRTHILSYSSSYHHNRSSICAFESPLTRCTLPPSE